MVLRRHDRSGFSDGSDPEIWRGSQKSRQSSPGSRGSQVEKRWHREQTLRSFRNELSGQASTSDYLLRTDLNKIILR